MLKVERLGRYILGDFIFPNTPKRRHGVSEDKTDYKAPKGFEDVFEAMNDHATALKWKAQAEQYKRERDTAREEIEGICELISMYLRGEMVDFTNDNAVLQGIIRRIEDYFKGLKK